MNLVLDFLFNELDDNVYMELNEDCEIEISEDSESEATATTGEESSSFRDKPATDIKKKVSSSKSKRRCIFNQQWLKDPKYALFLRECQTNKYFAHCSICKSNFSIANGGIYLVNRHIEQAGHKRLAETQEKEKCKV
jgi:hypothetical protein